jgi:RNA polymerase sigma factor, sigma-70 family
MNLEQFKISVVPLRAKLLNCARRMTDGNADTEDVVQEAFLKLWYMREKLDEYQSVEALAMTMVKNLCLDRWRTLKPQGVELEKVMLNSEIANPEQELEQQDNIKLIREIIESLPPVQQTIIRMKDIEGYEMDEIAMITGTGVEAVRSNLSRARKKVRDTFLLLTKDRKEIIK